MTHVTPETMHETAKRFIKHHEGLKLHPYRDTLNHWSWGYGCQITDDLIRRYLNQRAWTEHPQEQWPLTQHQADLLFDMAFSRAANHALGLLERANPKAPLTSPRAGALISMAYQLGRAGLAGFRQMWGGIHADDWRKASEHALNSRWAKQTPARAIETAEILRTNEWPGWLRKGNTT